MDQAASDREAQRRAIKSELKRALWDDRSTRPDHGRYVSLFILNPEPMWVYDAETQQILDVNEAAIRRYGYTRAEFLDMTIRDLRPAADVPKFLELTHDLPRFDRSGPWRHRLKSDQVIQVVITSHAVTYEGRDSRVVMAELADSADLDVG